MKYLALLRGVNVGGKGKVEMSRLKLICEELGYENVKTYINSGNVVFTGPRKDVASIATEIEASLQAEYDRPIRALVITSATMAKIAADLPEGWVHDKAKQKCDIMFVWPEFAKPSVIDQFVINEEHEEIRYRHGTIQWRADVSYLTRTKVTRILMATDLYQNVTIRNCNTFWKLNAMLEELP